MRWLTNGEYKLLIVANPLAIISSGRDSAVATADPGLILCPASSLPQQRMI